MRSIRESCGPEQRKGSSWSRVYRARTRAVRRLYTEAGCLGQRPREGRAALRSGRLLSYRVSVLKVSLGWRLLGTYRMPRSGK